METQERKDQDSGMFKGENNFRSGRAFGGLIVVVVGVLLLARRAGADLPDWLFSGAMIPIAIGLYIGARSSFRNWIWLLPFGIGVLLLSQEFIEDFSVRQFIWPIIIICVGLAMIIRPRRRRDEHWRDWRNFVNSPEKTDDNFLDITTIFGGMKKQVITKDFKGGDITTFFGGTELNLMQADMPERAVIDITQVFGGTKLLVPANWKVKTSDVVAIFGGIEDKRPIQSQPDYESAKVLVLTGTCIFGGIDIRSY